MSARTWAVGDRVRLPARPGWGTGEVVSATGHVHEGERCQQVKVRFERAGLKTLSTGIADLQPAEDPAPAVDGGEPRGWLEEAERGDPSEVLQALPESLTDPFTALPTRFERTLSALGFSSEGGSLVEWAGWRTGLKDPLSRFTRSELEQHFAQFRARLERHAAKLHADLRGEAPDRARELLDRAPAGARAVLDRRGARR